MNKTAEQIATAQQLAHFLLLNEFLADARLFTQHRQNTVLSSTATDSKGVGFTTL